MPGNVPAAAIWRFARGWEPNRVAVVENEGEPHARIPFALGIQKTAHAAGLMEINNREWVTRKIIASRLPGRKKMLSLEFAPSHTQELKLVVAERCSSFGTVSEVVIRSDRGRPSYSFALVKMSKLRETIEVARGIGETMYGNAAVIWLDLPAS